MNPSIIPKQQLLPALLGLRAAAAIAVLLYHLFHLVKLPLPPGCGFVGTHFGLGVKLFFVLSGFSLCHSTCHTLGRETWIRDYALKRLFRIAPLFYAMLLVWVVFFRLRGVATDFSTLVLNLSFTYNLVPGKHESLVAAGWTIGVEMLFYCLLPVLLATIQNLRAATCFFLIAAVVSEAGREALAGGGELLARYAGLSFIGSLVVFAAGIAAYHGWRAVPAGRWPAVPVAVVTLGLAALVLSPLRAGLLGPWRLVIPLWSLCFAGLTIWQAAAPGRLLASRPMLFLGDRSYSIYLLHPLAIVLLKEPIRQIHAASTSLVGDWAFFVAGGFVTLVVVAAATVTYALIEVPGIRLGRWLIGRRPAGGSTADAVPITAAGPPTDPGGPTTAPR
jgi:peptidoglycan/LPS O-acetylase OafA/YrhL